MPETSDGFFRDTYVYKTVGSLDIKADVYSHGTRDAPTVVWIHGGALIFGRRDSPPEWLLDLCLQDGFVLISIDYRLAPETKLPEIVTDVEDAFAWVAKGASSSRRTRQLPIAAVGESAGGYLALTAGFRAHPTPAAIISLWGYGQLTGSWYTEPSPHPVHNQVHLPIEEAQREVSGPAIADERQRQGDGYVFYQVCRQRGTWPLAVSGWDPITDTDKFAPYTPLRNVSGTYPPTLLIHGTNDTDVPCQESLRMANILRSGGVEHCLIAVQDAEHGLFQADPEETANAYRHAARFLRVRLH